MYFFILFCAFIVALIVSYFHYIVHLKTFEDGVSDREGGGLHACVIRGNLN